MEGVDLAQIEREIEKVELFFSCRNLKNLDILSLTDPQIIIYLEVKGQYIKYDQTEWIHDNLNPQFTKTVIMDYYFETKQKLRFEILHGEVSKKHEVIGNIYTTLGEIIGSKNQTYIKDIMKSDKKMGTLIVKCEKVEINNSTVTLDLQCSELLNVAGWFSKDNPVIKLYRTAGDSGYVAVYESEVIKKTKNPTWKTCSLKVQKLCNGDLMRPIKAEVFSRNGYTDKPIGQCEFTIDEIISQEKREYVLTNKKKNKKAGKLKI
jgi:hypothetical protein